MLNCDNIAITAQSFDYGPWRFTPIWDGAFTAAYFDHAGLYAFARQPEAIHWDLVQLAIVAAPIAEAEPLTPRSKPSRTSSSRRCATRSSPGSASAPASSARDMALVGAIEETLSPGSGRDRPLLVRLARRTRAAGRL